MSAVLPFTPPPPPTVRGQHDRCPDCRGVAWAPAGPGHLRCCNCDLLVRVDRKGAA